MAHEPLLIPAAAGAGNAELIEKLVGPDAAPSTITRTALARIEAQAEEIVKAREVINRDGTLTAEGRQLARATAADRLMRPALAAADAGLKKLHEHGAELDRAYALKLVPPKDAAEIRAYLRARENPCWFVTTRLNAGDAGPAAAAFAAPSYLSGLGDEAIAALREHAERVLDPTLHAERQAVAKAMTLLQRAGS